jgi:hypothetical protein
MFTVHPEQVVGMPPPQRDRDAGDTGGELGDRNGRQQSATSGRLHHDGDRLASRRRHTSLPNWAGDAEESPMKIRMSGPFELPNTRERGFPVPTPGRSEDD